MTNPNPASTLAACPFDGGACAVTKGYSASELPWCDDGGDFFRVYCAKCQSRQLFHRTEAEAIEAWNRRASTPSAAPVAVGEAVAWWFDGPKGLGPEITTFESRRDELIAAGRQVIPLYAHPPTAQVAWPQPLTGWQPVETAPRDGAHVMLGHPDFVGEGFWVEALEDGVDYMGNDAGFMDAHYRFFTCGRSFGSEKYRGIGIQPTHWMPLPEAPAIGTTSTDSGEGKSHE